MIDTI